MDVENVDYWDLESTDQLYYEDKDEAIKAILDNSEEIPLTIDLCGYRRMKIKESSESIAEDILERLLKRLDEDYSNPDGDYTEITEDMKKIAKEFVEKFMPMYDVWQCEIVCREKIDIKKWRADNQAKG